MSSNLLIEEERRLSWREWTLLIIVETASLYTHYFGVLIIGSVSLLAGAYLMLGRRWRDLRMWIGAQGLALMLYLPWMWVATRQLVAYVPKWAEPLGVADFAQTIWRFSVVGMTQLRDTHPAGFRTADAFGLLVVAALPLVLSTDRRRTWTLAMLLHFVVPAVVIFAMDHIRSGMHPRYLMIFYLALLLFLGRAIALLATEGPLLLRSVGLVLSLAFISVSALGLQIHYFDEAYHKDDVRSVAKYLEERSGEEDLIISDYDDLPCLRYYYHGSSATCFLKMEGPELPLIAHLKAAMRGKERVFFVKWTRGQSDRRDIIPFYLEFGGRLLERRDFLGLTVLTYQLERSFPLPELESLFADFGLFQLSGTFFERAAPSDDAIALALRWRLMESTDREYKVAVKLWDERGHLISSADSFLLDEDCYPTKRWPAGREVTNFYVLPIAPGTPPLSYTITVEVYDEVSMRSLDLLSDAKAPVGKRFTLGSVKLSEPRRFPPTSAYGPSKHFPWTPVGVTLAKGLSLEDFSLERASVRPGDQLTLALKWRAIEDDLPEYIPKLRLLQGEKVIASTEGAPGNGHYSTVLWSKGEVVIDWRDLMVSPAAEEGSVVLELAVDDSTWIPLAELEVISLERLFEVPNIAIPLQARFGEFAELLGYKLDHDEVFTGQEVGLTLYWRAKNPKPLDISYTVFTHLLDQEGKLIGQHDGPPALGEHPTTSWVEGEIIADYHPMRFKERDFSGRASIEIGLYDQVTGKRVPLSDGADHLILSSQVRVESE